MTPHARAKAGSEQAPVLAPWLCWSVVRCWYWLSSTWRSRSHRSSARRWWGGPAAAAALGTTYALAYGLGFLIFGPLSDRYGRKPVLVAGMAVLAIATAGMAVASSLSTVAVVRTVQGLVAASFSAVALAYVGEALPPRWRTTGIGAMSTAFLSAGILGQVFAQAVAQAIGWRWCSGWPLRHLSLPPSPWP